MNATPKSGADGEYRPHNLSLTRRLLCRLSYISENRWGRRPRTAQRGLNTAVKDTAPCLRTVLMNGSFVQSALLKSLRRTSTVLIDGGSRHKKTLISRTDQGFLPGRLKTFSLPAMYAERLRHKRPMTRGHRYPSGSKRVSFETRAVAGRKCVQVVHLVFHRGADYTPIKIGVKRNQEKSF